MSISRRTFLEGLGVSVVGLALGIFSDESVAADTAVATLSPLFAAPTTPGLRPNVFIHVAPDGWVSIVCHRSEMGQGIRSSLPALMADELGASMKFVKIIQGDGDTAYGDQNTDGSTSIRNIFEKIRLISATARTMLTSAAATRWKVSPETCEAHDHFVFHKPTKRKLAFGDLALAAGALPIPEVSTVKLRPKKELRSLKKTLPVVDAANIVKGTAVFGADIRLPGMLTAVIARPPVVGGTIAKFGKKKALAVAGVKHVIELPVPKPPYLFQPFGGVAVIADNTWSAIRGREALEAAWNAGPNASYDSNEYRKTLMASVQAPGTPLRNTGDVEAALKGAARVHEADYYVPHLAHAPMEPPSAVARVEGGKCEVWVCTQNPQVARTSAAKALGISEDNVTVHVTLLGGGFGRKSKADFVVEAVLLSKAAGVPVRVQWTRDDDIRHGYYNTVSAQRLSVGFDKENKVVAWRHRTAFPPIGSTFAEGVDRPGPGDLQQGVLDLALNIPNVRAEAGAALPHARIGWLRSVYNIFHAFSVGSFIDEIANLQKRDPREVLLELHGPSRKASLAELGIKELKNYGATLETHPVDVGRLRHVIERVTDNAKWKQRKKNGRFLGLAAHRSFVSYVGVVASAVRKPDGKVAIDEVWLVADAGTVVNVDRARAQMEGAVLFGMSLAYYGAITMKAGAVEQSNFNDYQVIRMNEAPKQIHVEIVQSDLAPGGVGEPGVPPVAPAIANAIFAATGKRLRELPLSNSGLLG